MLAQSNELGAAMLGVPEELGGVMTERSAVTSVLVTEKLAHGDMGLAAAILSPGAVSTAISLWGDADQQAKYLPPFTEDDAPAAALAVQEPRVLFDPLELDTVAARSPEGFTLNGTKSLVLRAADAELFVVAARIEDEGPALFIVESGTDGPLRRARPGDGRARRGHRHAGAGGRERGLPDALLGGADPAVYSEMVQRARIAWSAMALGTGRAVLDYVIPYVNDRQAFGEPISNRQAVAFTVSDIAIELEGMKLTTWRAASRADLGKSFAKEATIARQLVAERGMQIGSVGRAAAGRPRLRQGIPRRTLVPGSSGRRRDGRSSARLMINLEIPSKFKPMVGQAHQVATEIFRPISRKYDLAEHEYPKELDALAALLDGMDDSRRQHAARAPAAPAAPPTTTAAATATAPTCPRSWGSWSCAGATSGCCCRCRARASATRRSPLSRTPSRPSATTACGPAWPSPSRRRARTRPPSAPPRSWMATSTCSTARRST